MQRSPLFTFPSRAQGQWLWGQPRVWVVASVTARGGFRGRKPSAPATAQLRQEGREPGRELSVASGATACRAPGVAIAVACPNRSFHCLSENAPGFLSFVFFRLAALASTPKLGSPWKGRRWRALLRFVLPLWDWVVLFFPVRGAVGLVFLFLGYQSVGIRLQVMHSLPRSNACTGVFCKKFRLLCWVFVFVFRRKVIVAFDLRSALDRVSSRTGSMVVILFLFLSCDMAFKFVGFWECGFSKTNDHLALGFCAVYLV